MSLVCFKGAWRSMHSRIRELKRSTCMSGSSVEYTILRGSFSKSSMKASALKFFSFRINLYLGTNLVMRTLIQT